jgi:hypothetical protein
MGEVMVGGDKFGRYSRKPLSNEDLWARYTTPLAEMLVMLVSCHLEL